MAGYIDLRSTLSVPQPENGAGRAIVWLDIDNTLYNKSSNIHVLMQEKIHAYFLSMGLESEEAKRLHKSYYRDYGLAIRGLVKHHDIDALEYDLACDASLPLETILSPNPALRKLLLAIDPKKARIIGLTNAYKTHGLRVLQILGIDDLFESLVFCDYGKPDGDFGCKPERSFFEEALAFVHPSPPPAELPPNYFVDDSLLNVTAAQLLGWNSIHYKESGEWDTDHGRVNNLPVKNANGEEINVVTVDDLEGLRDVWKELFL